MFLPCTRAPKNIYNCNCEKQRERKKKTCQDGRRGGEKHESLVCCYTVCAWKSAYCVKNRRERRPSQGEGRLSLTTLLYSVGEILFSQKHEIKGNISIGKRINQSIDQSIGWLVGRSVDWWVSASQLNLNWMSRSTTKGVRRCRRSGGRGRFQRTRDVTSHVTPLTLKYK